MYDFHVTVTYSANWHAVSARRVVTGRVVALDRAEAIREASRRYGVPARAISAVNVGPAPGRINGLR